MSHCAAGGIWGIQRGDKKAPWNLHPNRIFSQSSVPESVVLTPRLPPSNCSGLGNTDHSQKMGQTTGRGVGNTRGW